jgi:hypothetical protein
MEDYLNGTVRCGGSRALTEWPLILLGYFV